MVAWMGGGGIGGGWTRKCHEGFFFEGDGHFLNLDCGGYVAVQWSPLIHGFAFHG